MRNDFQKEDCQGENPFAKGAPRTASNPFVQALSKSKARDIEVHCWPHAQWTWTLFPKTPILLRRKGEKWLIGASAHDKWVRFQLTAKTLVLLAVYQGCVYIYETVERLVAACN